MNEFNNPENIITWFYQALEVEYFLENPDSKIDNYNLDKSLLIASGFFYSQHCKINKKHPPLAIKEISLMASYCVNRFNLEKNKKTHRANRLIFFIVMYKVGLMYFAINKPISTKEGSSYLIAVNHYDGFNVQTVVNANLKDLVAPIGHVVLTKQLVKDYPNWFKFESMI